MSQKKTVFITGGNRGIGRGLVEHFSNEHNVYFTVRKQTHDLPKNATALIMDVTDETSIKKAASIIKSDIDILINNAGVFLDYEKPALEASIDEMEETFKINTLGPLKVIKNLYSKLAKNSRIINISSGMGQFHDMGSGAIAYRMSKSALNCLSKVLANELKTKDISVNAICPGWVKTDMGGKGAHREIDESVSHIVKFALSENFPTGKFLRDGKEIPW